MTRRDGSYEVLRRAHLLAMSYLDQLSTRPVAARSTSTELLRGLPRQLQEDPEDPASVIAHLAALADAGLVASAGPRYFGFVTGGSLPVAVAADWLVSAWDQNAALHVMSPMAAAVEDAVAGYVLDLLTLPRGPSVGFVTGATMANATALAAARHEVLRRVGWDVEALGLQGAPTVRVIAGAEAHASVLSACRLIGFGSSTVIRAAADNQGRMLPDALGRRLAEGTGPAIVCAQAGNVNTGAFDPLSPIADLAAAHGAWLHVDGAFGLWAAAVPALRHHLLGVERADSWALDAHKWLNVPYDSGIAIVAHPAAHRAAMAQTAAYLIRGTNEQRDGMDWTPEASRRARALPIYATLRTLGRDGVEALVSGSCRLAGRMAACLSACAGISVLNDVVLNQVLIRIASRRGDNVTPDAIALVQKEGVCWVGGTTWAGQPALRISISGWCTTEEDIDRCADSLLRAATAVW